MSWNDDEISERQVRLPAGWYEGVFVDEDDHTEELPEFYEPVDTEVMEQAERDFDWYQTHFESLRRTYGGEHVAIFEERVVAHSTGREELRQELDLKGIPYNGFKPQALIQYIPERGETLTRGPLGLLQWMTEEERKPSKN